MNNTAKRRFAPLYNHGAFIFAVKPKLPLRRVAKYLFWPKTGQICLKEMCIFTKPHRMLSMTIS